jgi:hypothetical protein
MKSPAARLWPIDDALLQQIDMFLVWGVEAKRLGLRVYVVVDHDRRRLIYRQ